MCGIFGIISKYSISKSEFFDQARLAERRGKDSSGIILYQDGIYKTYKSDNSTTNLISSLDFQSPTIAMGHSRLITDGMNDNQPVIRNGVAVLHNGIITNCDQIWSSISIKRTLEIDSEIIVALTLDSLDLGHDIDTLANRILSICKGTISCALLIPKIGKLILISNNGSLYHGRSKNESLFFASEKFSLSSRGINSIEKVNGYKIFDMPPTTENFQITEIRSNRINLIPKLNSNSELERMLEYKRYTGIRCTKCVLPETMPFISFNHQGICNYCLNYKKRNSLRPLSVLMNEISPYIKKTQDLNCIVPFSGGRDSTYALHIIKKELGLNPITFTYDWGMVTDLARRNISRLCSSLSVENIVIADDIKLKRTYIATNLIAWLRKPDLGMLNLLMAGDKHFFRYLKHIQRETSIDLNIWGMCPLETTHFKAGFLGVQPYFNESKVYTSGLINQVRYQAKRFTRMVENPYYFNRSLWDTLSGEYYRSIKRKNGYYHLFDYIRWNENEVNKVLDIYDWEKAPDTESTWRIGDGTAAFYNYIYRTVAGFSEHDTFRSNQIREGDISRDSALLLIERDNLPRYQNIKWYLDTLNLDYKDVISKINNIPRLF